MTQVKVGPDEMIQDFWLTEAETSPATTPATQVDAEGDVPMSGAVPHRPGHSVRDGEGVCEVLSGGSPMSDDMDLDAAGRREHGDGA
ncbi:hypothetical protein [Streptomyces sp. NPDC002067]